MKKFHLCIESFIQDPKLLELSFIKVFNTIINYNKEHNTYKID